MIAPLVTQVPAAAVLVDVRPAGAYAAGHAPGAVRVDLDADLAAAPAPGGEGGRHPLPTPEAFARAMAAAGVGERDVVVAYDTAGGVLAARLVWMLRALGVEAALLEAHPPLTDTTDERRPATFAPRPWPADRLVDADHVRDGDVLLDARPRSRYDGAPDPLDPRPGHIPGAVSLPCRENVGLGAGALAARLADVGVGPGTDVVSSCGSGVTACHTLLVLDALGYRPGRLYVGSYSEWAGTGRDVVTS